jgi:acetate kinase
MREHRLSQQELETALNFESGLKGIGGSSDMRDLLSRQHEQRAHLAVQMFVHRLKSSIGALAASLGGFNVLNFTGGIGENAASIREETCRGLDCLQVAIDLEKNEKCLPDQEITSSASKVSVLVIHTREDWMIAKACFEYH